MATSVIIVLVVSVVGAYGSYRFNSWRTRRALRRARASDDPLMRVYATRFAAAEQVANVGFSITFFIACVIGLLQPKWFVGVPLTMALALVLGFLVARWYVRRLNTIAEE